MTSTTSGGGGKVASWLDDQLRGYNPKLTVGISKSIFWKMMFLLKEMILRFDFFSFRGSCSNSVLMASQFRHLVLHVRFQDAGNMGLTGLENHRKRFVDEDFKTSYFHLMSMRVNWIIVDRPGFSRNASAILKLPLVDVTKDVFTQMK